MRNKCTIKDLASQTFLGTGLLSPPKIPTLFCSVTGGVKKMKLYIMNRQGSELLFHMFHRVDVKFGSFRVYSSLVPNDSKL